MGAIVTGAPEKGFSNRSVTVCPFVEKPDPRCAAGLTLHNIMRALTLCADRYASCPVYQERIAHVRPYEPQPGRLAAS